MSGADWTQGWWAWCAPSALQATLLLLLAWSADRLLVRRVWPELLSVLWLLALVRFFLPPDLRSPVSMTAGLAAPTLAAAEALPNARSSVFLFAAWAAGAAALVVFRCARRASLHSRILLREPSPEWLAALERAARQMRVRRLPRVGTLGGLATPAVFGALRPVLLVPGAWLERAPTRRDEHALLHELAHVKRGDLWLDEACALIRAALWFHPLAWIAFERLRALGELQCDSRVARALGREARSYRDSLVLAAKHLIAEPAPSGLRAFVATQSAIVLRIERLDRTSHFARGAACSQSLVRGASALTVLALAACVLPMASRGDDLRAQARHVLAAERNGALQSCFSIQAAAMVLAADSSDSPPRH